ncbi:MAG: flavodoxin family protein [Rhodanobacter sp.]|jgi:NAD(P)H dehydrogenase (quinone)|nr:flavodoxin family protein [Rhodanobacter sp.]
MAHVAIVYHSGYGHTKKQAQAVLAGVQAAGAQAHLISVAEVTDDTWALLAGVDAIIFGTPTYMGGASADFKKFAEASSRPWSTGQWKDKIAAGFTNSASMNGDKYSSIQYLWTLSQQHGMIWVGTGMLPANSKAAQRNDVNYLAGFGGALAQSPSDASPEEGPLPGDLETARLFGQRVAAIAEQFVRGRQ